MNPLRSVKPTVQTPTPRPTAHHPPPPHTHQANATDQDGLTPLHYAATCDHLAIAELLIKAGANPTAADMDGETPLSSASSGAMKGLLSAE